MKRAYRGKDDPKQDFIQLMQMNMLQQQQERAEDRKERAADRQQMMTMMMAMMSGRQPPPVAPPPRFEEEDSDIDNLDLDNILVPVLVPKRAPPVAAGVVT